MQTKKVVYNDGSPSKGGVDSSDVCLHGKMTALQALRMYYQMCFVKSDQKDPKRPNDVFILVSRLIQNSFIFTSL
jgi:hypothetical protein